MKPMFNKDKMVKIVKLPDLVLRKKSKDVPIPLTAEDEELAQIMIKHIDDSQGEHSKYQAGVGVAAVQYGVLKNVFYINNAFDPQNKGLRDVLFNPKVIATSEQLVALSEGEGCLSVPQNWTKDNIEGLVPRRNRIVVKAYSYFERKWKTYDVIGYDAIIMQHELDHLMGHVFFDRIDDDLDQEKIILL